MTPRQRINASGLAIIKHYESFSPVPYLCPARVWTIGYGHTKGVTKNSAPVTVAQAEELLRADVQDAELAVARLVNVPLTSNQFSALVSLVFNIGSGRFQSSTLRMRLNRGDYDGAADQFRVWRMGGGRVLNGLIARRARERALFDAPDSIETPQKNTPAMTLAQAIKAAAAKISGSN